MPILPEALIDFLFAPVPFLAGIHQSYQIDVPADVILYSFDTELFSFFQFSEGKN